MRIRIRLPFDMPDWPWYVYGIALAAVYFFLFLMKKREGKTRRDSAAAGGYENRSAGTGGGAPVSPPPGESAPEEGEPFEGAAFLGDIKGRIDQELPPLQAYLAREMTENMVAKKEAGKAFRRTFGLFLAGSLGIIAAAFFLRPGQPFFALYQSRPLAGYLPIMGLAAFLYGAGFWGKKSLSRLARAQQKEMGILNYVLEKLFPSFRFSRTRVLSGADLERSKLFQGVSGSIPPATMGCAAGRLGNRDMEIFDIGLKEDSPKNRLIDLITAVPVLNQPVILYRFFLKNAFRPVGRITAFSFRGIFCRVELRRVFDSWTVLFPRNSAYRLHQAFNRSFGEETRIHLEDPLFNQQFSVFGSDQTAARFFLTSAVMERISRFREEAGQAVALSLVGGTLFFTLERPEGFFSFREGEEHTENLLKDLARDILFLIEISTDISENY